MSYEQIPGWFTSTDVECYRNLAGSIHNGALVELGVFAGRSAISIGDICKANGNLLYCVDHWRGSSEYNSDHKYFKAIEPTLIAAGWPNIYETFLFNIEKENLTDILIPVCSNSHKAHKKIPTPVDMVFVDAEHTFKAVCRDIHTWLPHIKPGGIIAGHDYHENWPEVIQAVHHFFNNDDVCLHGEVWYVRV